MTAAREALGQHTPVRLRFVPQGPGAWQIDDVYVDPFKRF